MPVGITSTMVDLEMIRDLVRKAQVVAADDLARFHRWWYGLPFTVAMTTYQGVRTMKNPLDLWVVAEIIFAMKPTVIIETGTAWGGSALYYADCMARSGAPGQVISIDVDADTPVRHDDRIRYVRGLSSTDPQLVAGLRDMLEAVPDERVMVILDSDHSADHVRAELDAYAPLVTKDQFLIVEDTNVNHEVEWQGGPGPREALDAWLPMHPEFQRDPLAERYLLTMYPGGWLRKVA